MGAADRNLVGMSFPLDQGIAGYVAMTGQPIAISDVQQDARFNQSFAKQTGYVPKSILAMPLLSGERVIGVMEVLDKISAPSFGMRDMELLALFAKQAALAIAQSQQSERMAEALLLGLREIAGPDAALAASTRRDIGLACGKALTGRRQRTCWPWPGSSIRSPRSARTSVSMCLHMLGCFRRLCPRPGQAGATRRGFGGTDGGYA